jgi:hypothetical protein
MGKLPGAGIRHHDTPSRGMTCRRAQPGNRSGYGFLCEIPPTRHPGMLPAGVQDFKKLLSDFKVRELGSNRPKAGGPVELQPRLVPEGFRPGTCWNDEGGMLCFVVTRRAMGVSLKSLGDPEGDGPFMPGGGPGRAYATTLHQWPKPLHALVNALHEAWFQSFGRDYLGDFCRRSPAYSLLPDFPFNSVAHFRRCVASWAHPESASLLA